MVYGVNKISIETKTQTCICYPRFLSPTGTVTAIRDLLWWGWGEIYEESDACPTSKLKRLFFFQFTPCNIPNFPIGVGAVGEWGGIGVGVGSEMECESDSCPTSVSTPKAARGGGDTGVQSYQETPD